MSRLQACRSQDRRIVYCKQSGSSFRVLSNRQRPDFTTSLGKERLRVGSRVTSCLWCSKIGTFAPTSAESTQILYSQPLPDFGHDFLRRPGDIESYSVV